VLPERPDSYIWDFISRKSSNPVKKRTLKSTAPFHTGTLWFYFHNFLLTGWTMPQRHSLPSPEPPPVRPAEFDLFALLKPEDVQSALGCHDATHA